MHLTDQQLAHFRREGYVLVPGAVDRGTAAAVIADADARLAEPAPEAGSGFNAPPKALDWLEFPLPGTAANGLAVSDVFLGPAKRLLGDDVLLAQCGVMVKEATRGGVDQPLHGDYVSHELLVPRRDLRYGSIAMILYLTDVTVEHGPTYVVGDTSATRSDWPPIASRGTDDDALYEQEQPVVAEAGTLLVYTVRTWHRGSAFRAPDDTRYTLHATYVSADAPWSGWRDLPKRTGADLDRALNRMTPEQRAVLGVPRPGHPYWDQETLEAVARRYPGWDLSPYRAALVDA